MKSKTFLTGLILLASAINTSAQVGSNIVSGLLHTVDSVHIYVDALVGGEDGKPANYERIYTGVFIDSYTFKTPSYRDYTIQYCSNDRCRMAKVVEGGQSENFHEIDVHFRRNFTYLVFKTNARSGQFKVVNILTK